MNHRQVGKMWDENADTWTRLSRMGCDRYRNLINTPAFMALLPEVDGLRGLDIGCGEGYNTRILAQKGARMTAFDIAPRFVAHASNLEHRRKGAIHYQVASAVALPFGNEVFDFVTAFMSFMDIPDHASVVREAYRVLKPGGFLQFSISHPCFATPRWEWLRNPNGEREALVCGDYFKESDGQIEEWIFGATPSELKDELPKFKIPRFTRILSSWLNLLLDAGFVLERFQEPQADEKTLRAYPKLQDSTIIAYFLIIRCRKPTESTGACP
jgi:SAM-dependent methyltransferase